MWEMLVVQIQRDRTEGGMCESDLSVRVKKAGEEFEQGNRWAQKERGSDVFSRQAHLLLPHLLLITVAAGIINPILQN